MEDLAVSGHASHIDLNHLKEICDKRFKQAYIWNYDQLRKH